MRTPKINYNGGLKTRDRMKIAIPENAAPNSMQEWKTRDWKT